MQKQEPGKSNLKFSDLRVIGVNSMNRKHRNSFIALCAARSLFFVLQQVHKKPTRASQSRRPRLR